MSLIRKTFLTFKKEGFAAALVKIARYLKHHASSLFYPVFYLAGYPRTIQIRNRAHRLLRKMIKGKRVLIVGSGPSAAELKDIPPDVKVFTCNRGLQLFWDRGWKRKIDLYLCTASKIARFDNIYSILKNVKIHFLLVDDPAYVRKRREFAKNYSALIPDDGKHNHYLKRLIRPRRVRDIRGDSYHPWTSTGIRLLQYALYFEAEEIYLVGIDFGNDGYFWGPNGDKWLHHGIDENFLKIVASRHKRLYSLSNKSRLAEWLPHRDFSTGETVSPATEAQKV